MNNKVLKNTRAIIPIMFKLLVIMISIKIPILAKRFTGPPLLWKLQLYIYIYSGLKYSSYTLQDTVVTYIKRHNYSANYIFAFKKYLNSTNIASSSSSVSCRVSLALSTSRSAAITRRCQNLFGWQDRWDFQNEMYLWLFATIYIKCLI